jgi:hypothetical protein
MPGILFRQSLCLLTDGTASISDVLAAITTATLNVTREIPAANDWQHGGSALMVACGPGRNDAALVDVVNQPWPDSMGDPSADPVTFGAWALGHFGSFAYPGSLSRAMQHNWSWKAARGVAESHRGFIRIRMVTLADPDDADAKATLGRPLDDLVALNTIVLALQNVRGVLCYFNPNGELLQDLASYRRIADDAAAQQRVPLLLWSNVRLFNLDSSFGFMDTVGNAQFGVTDLEAVYPKQQHDPATIDYYMRNVTHYLIGLGRELRTGERIDGPGETQLSWTIESLDTGTITPPRRVLRLFPKSDTKAIRRALEANT